MLFGVNKLKGYNLHAKDGQMGKLEEVYFDDGCWWIRYLVINVGSWLNRKQVLLIPDVVEGIDAESNEIAVSLMKKEVEGSPDALVITPVSREREIALHRHYDWTPYWHVDPVASAGYGRVPETIVRPYSGVKANVDVANDATAFADARVQDRASGVDAEANTREAEGKVFVAELHPSGRLQSSKDVSGYHVQAPDGEIGHVDDFLVDPTLQVIQYLVIDTRDWLPGKKVVVPPRFVSQLQSDGSKIHLGLSKDQIQQAPEFEGEKGAVVSDEMEVHLLEYYRHKMLFRVL